MSNYIDKLKKSTRWDNIPGQDGYKLLCSNPTCSLSCANIRSGRVAVTSMHGLERHSYLLTPNDMLFASIVFLNNLDKEDLRKFANIFNKVSEEIVLSFENI